MMYGKLVAGYLVLAEEMFPTEDEYIKAGYKRVITTPYPTKVGGYTYLMGWEESDAITQTWTLTPLTDDLDDSEALSIILGGAE